MLLVAILMVGVVVLIVGFPHLRSSGRARLEAFIESEVLAVRRTGKGAPEGASSAGACSRCGAVYDQADSFCRSCGTRLEG